MKLFDDRVCELGEGLLRHPLRDQLFWFDILGRRLLSRTEADGPLEWEMPEICSAAGWVDETTLFVAGETGFWRFDIETGAMERLGDMEADDPVTRSNDGRADPMGGFWIGTMGKNAEAGAGAIYRWFRGELRKLYAPITIPNSICFSPDKAWAYMTDTPARMIWRVRLDMAGWPSLKREPFLDLTGAGLNPDGAITDGDGNLWVAQWGAGRVACHAPDGRFLRAANLPAAHATCPAFAGPNRLVVTSATEHIDPEALVHQPGAGRTWELSVHGTPWDEPRVVIR